VTKKRVERRKKGEVIDRLSPFDQSHRPSRLECGILENKPSPPTLSQLLTSTL
jgi:hypothetical protein